MKEKQNRRGGKEGLSHTWSSSNDTGAVTQILKNVKREAPDLSGIRPLGVGEEDGHQEDALTVEC